MRKEFLRPSALTDDLATRLMLKTIRHAASSAELPRVSAAIEKSF
ncbi:hypothetical protein C4J94_2103 [Pseudomonas sp. R5-89-07]|nr:hypothetical protein C4J94_2103 [Pseudomonas sp. R5-89-07]